MSANQSEARLTRQPDGGRIRFERTFPHPLEQVWAALTERDRLAEWLGEVDLEPRAGGAIRGHRSASGAGIGHPGNRSATAFAVSLRRWRRGRQHGAVRIDDGGRCNAPYAYAIPGALRSGACRYCRRVAHADRHARGVAGSGHANSLVGAVRGPPRPHLCPGFRVVARNALADKAYVRMLRRSPVRSAPG